MVTLYLVRHGETHENVAQLLQGHLPGQLTAKGRMQAAILRDQLSNISFDALLCSDLQRALDTANILNEPHQLPIISYPMLRERDWGVLTGTSITEKRKLQQFPPSVESVEAMHKRAKKLLADLIAHYDHQTILAVGHGLFNRCIQATIQGCTIADTPRMTNAEVRILQLHIDKPHPQNHPTETGVTAE